MRLDEGEIVKPDAGLGQRAVPGDGSAFKRGRVAAGERQEIVDLHRGAELHRLAERAGGLLIGQHQGGGAIGDQRAIGALQWRGYIGVLVAYLAAERIAEILAHLGVRIVHAIGMVLCRNRRQRVRLVAIGLEITLGDAAEHARKPGRDVALFLAIGRVEQNIAHHRTRRRRHLLRANDQRNPAAAGRDPVTRAMHRSRAGRTRILIPCGRRETQLRHGLKHQARREILLRKAVVEHTDKHRLDLGGGDARVLDGSLGDQRHQ